MRKNLLVTFGLLFILCGSVFAQQQEGTSHDTKYHFTAQGKYEHVMHFTCQLFEGDVQIQDFEVAVFDQNGECRASAVSGKDANYKHVAYVMIHGTSGHDNGMSVRVVYGDETNPHRYDRLVEDLTIDMINLHSIGTTLEPYSIIVSGEPAYRWQVGQGALQQGDLTQLSAAQLQGATRLELSGRWEPAQLQQLHTALPKNTLNEVYFSSDFQKTDLNGFLNGCSQLTGVHFKAIPQTPAASWWEGVNPNCLIYLPAATATAPEGWNNVVLEGESGYTALTDLHLVGSTPDHLCPFALDKDLQLNGHTATFTPAAFNFANGKGGWNSLVLPFDAEAYADEVQLTGNRNRNIQKNAYWLLEYSGSTGTTIEFNYQRNGLAAHIPYLIAVPGDAFGTDFSLQNQAITFRSQSTVVKAVPAKIQDPYFESAPQDIEFLGTYSTRIAQPMYLLAEMNTGGNAFVFAEQGNLLPFHAYMQMRDNQAPTAKTLFFGGEYLPTGIEDLEVTTASPEVYDLSGRKVMDFEHASTGIYIVNGKRIFKK